MGNILNSATQEMAQVIQSKINSKKSSGLYLHCLGHFSRIGNYDQRLTFKIKSSSATPMTFTDVINYLRNNGFLYDGSAYNLLNSKFYPAIGVLDNTNFTYLGREIITGIATKIDEPNNIIAYGAILYAYPDELSGAFTKSLLRIDSSFTLTDKVIKIF